LEKHAVATFRVEQTGGTCCLLEDGGSTFLQNSDSYYMAGITSQKTASFIGNAMRTSNIYTNVLEDVWLPYSW
jgi:hypothetical protein